MKPTMSTPERKCISGPEQNCITAGCRRPPREGFCCATNRMRSRIASRENVTESSGHSLTQRAPVASVLSLEPSSSFSLFNVNYSLLWALWSCGRRAGVVQAQRQIHRAFAGQLTPPLTHFVTRVMLIRLIHWPRRGKSAGRKSDEAIGQLRAVFQARQCGFPIQIAALPDFLFRYQA